MSSSERRHCKTLLSYRWTHQTSLQWWTPPSWISPITAQRRPAYEHPYFCYVTSGAESEQPVCVPCYQWVGCRDHAGLACFPHSESWQTQGGPVYICRNQRTHVFHNMGPLICSVLHGCYCIHSFVATVYILIYIWLILETVMRTHWWH